MLSANFTPNPEFFRSLFSPYIQQAELMRL
jgi:hypothetical protein